MSIKEYIKVVVQVGKGHLPAGGEGHDREVEVDRQNDRGEVDHQMSIYVIN